MTHNLQCLFPVSLTAPSLTHGPVQGTTWSTASPGRKTSTHSRTDNFAHLYQLLGAFSSGRIPRGHSGPFQ